MLLAWLTPAKELAREVVPLPPPRRSLIGESIVKPPRVPPLAIGPGEPPPVVRFPGIEIAAHDLMRRQVVTQQQFNALDQDARRTAFTVARIQSVDSLAKIQRALAEDVAQGGTLKAFRARVAESVEGALSPAQVETVYRTQVASAYSAGQRAVMEHPLVADEFPYLLWSAVHELARQARASRHGKARAKRQCGLSR